MSDEQVDLKKTLFGVLWSVVYQRCQDKGLEDEKLAYEVQRDTMKFIDETIDMRKDEISKVNNQSGLADRREPTKETSE